MPWSPTTGVAIATKSIPFSFSTTRLWLRTDTPPALGGVRFFARKVISFPITIAIFPEKTNTTQKSESPKKPIYIWEKSPFHMKKSLAAEVLVGSERANLSSFFIRPSPFVPQPLAFVLPTSSFNIRALSFRSSPFSLHHFEDPREKLQPKHPVFLEKNAYRLFEIRENP
jgi:hypothetical protein